MIEVRLGSGDMGCYTLKNKKLLHIAIYTALTEVR